VPDYVYLVLLLIAPTLLVWRWNWPGVWLGALTLWLEIFILLLFDDVEDTGQMAILDYPPDYQVLFVSALLSLLYCLFVIGCKSWYKTLRPDR
jgi:hypothetical protein